MFTLLIFLIPLFQNLVSASEVISRLDHSFVTHILFPQHKLKPGFPKEVILSSTSGTEKFKVKCEEYEVHDPKMKLYTEDGVFLEAATVFSDSPCEERKIKSFIMPQEKEKDELVVIYRWDSKVPTCVRRTYGVDREAMVAIVRRSDYPVFACPSSVQGQEGGVVNLLIRDRTLVLDFTKNLGKAGVSRTLEFKKPDFKGKKFFFICREDRLNSGLDYVTGAIVHEDHDQVPLEKLEVKSCSVDNINMNRQIFNGRDDFKTVFKAEDGSCYEREYKFLSEKSLFYFNTLFESLEEPEEVPCPKSFEGDIEENAYRSLYTRLMNVIMFRRIEPYGREVVTFPSK